ncbi:hypothetical protein ABZP36_023160 [Zizania latifolia]
MATLSSPLLRFPPPLPLPPPLLAELLPSLGRRLPTRDPLAEFPLTRAGSRAPRRTPPPPRPWHRRRRPGPQKRRPRRKPTIRVGARRAPHQRVLRPPASHPTHLCPCDGHGRPEVVPQLLSDLGSWIDNGFYYDFDMEPLTDKDLRKTKKEMDRIIRKNLPLVREEVSREEAQKRIEALNEPYKLEILEGIKEGPITVYHIGEEWWDLCAGPHVKSTGKINRRAVELESAAGAYWRGDENNQMLQRIYGTAWETEDQLKAYVHFKEEAKRRDHQRLGQELRILTYSLYRKMLVVV